MAAAVPKVRHLVMELRYEPSLAFYSVMDKIGFDLAASYPDWERSALTLEIRDKKNKRRGFLSHQRSFFEAVDFANQAVEFEKAVKFFEKLHHELKFTRVRRIGIRQWAAVVLEEKFEKVVKDMARKLYSTEQALTNALHGTLDDMLFAVHVRANTGWKYHLKMGPMLRKQWFEVIPYERALFPDEEAFKVFKESIPETMVFIDFDGFQEDIPYSELSSAVASIRRGAEEVFRDLANYVTG